MSANILQKLNQDHKNIAKILFCLRSEISAFNDADSEPHLDQILNILDYISTVPERWHHPLEDIVFSKLLEKEPPFPEQIQAVLNEHQDLERLTQELKLAFERVSVDVNIPIAHLYKTATISLSRQMLHLDAEEAVLFPLADEYLNEDDWEVIEQISREQIGNNDATSRDEYDRLSESIFSFHPDKMFSIKSDSV